MIRIFICLLAFGLFAAADPLAAQGPAAYSAEDQRAQEAQELERQREAFYKKYAYSKSSRFNPRARAVVNPHPYPRPKFSAAYPDFPGVSERTFQKWELSFHNWRRASNAYDPYRPVRNCGYCGSY